MGDFFPKNTKNFSISARRISERLCQFLGFFGTTNPGCPNEAGGIEEVSLKECGVFQLQELEEDDERWASRRMELCETLSV